MYIDVMERERERERQRQTGTESTENKKSPAVSSDRWTLPLSAHSGEVSLSGC